MKKSRLLLSLLVVSFIVSIAKTEVKADSTWLWPVKGIYSLSRGYSSSHQGIDISANGIYGQQVLASKGGSVVSSSNSCPHVNSGDDRCNCNGGMGNYVILDHGDGTQTRYLHLVQGSAIGSGVSVSRGQVIGQVGSSGDSSGAHLHFDMWVNGIRVNNNPSVISYDYNGDLDPNSPEALGWRCYIDSPQNGASYTNTVQIKGWALMKGDITNITAWVNGHTMNVPREERKDVAAAYPGYPTGQEGFIATIPTEYLIEGENEVTIAAYHNGIDYGIGTVKFIYTMDENSPEALEWKCAIESPQQGERFSTGNVQIKGWALMKGEITHITAWVNGHAFNVSREERKDIAAIYPGYPTGQEGFTATVPQEYLVEGENEIIMAAYHNGIDYGLGSVKFYYDADPNSPEALEWKCAIESPQPGDFVSGNVQIKGWALMKGEITHVTAWVNGHTMNVPREERKDVAAAYPGYPTGQEGFIAIIPMEYLIEGENEVTVVAYHNGIDYGLGTVKFSYDTQGHVHSYTSNITVPSTCTTDGVRTYTCTICGAAKTETIKATGHVYGEWTTTKEPTTSAQGTKERVCQKCGNKETQSIPKLTNGGWKQDSQGWWYENTDGTYPVSCWKQIDGCWYYFNVFGYRVTGWQNIKNVWYYFDSKGIMQASKWIDNTYYVKDNGAMATGWLKLSEGWYYLNSSGKKLTGWQKSGNKWYYLDKQTGIMQISKWIDNTYYVNQDGTMATGWLQIGSKWYYLSNSGAKVTGWQKINNVWYYFDISTGVMYESKWLQNTYYLKAGGAMATGWQLIGSNYYYFDANGKKVTNKWVGNYYLKADGVMARSEWVDNGKYYVDENGKWVPGKAK